jgi:general secretion pathway protein D
VATSPATSFDLRSVGVNLSMTPRVTYDGEVILDQLVVEKSGLGPSLNIAGQDLPTFTNRRASTTIRLRDGESSMLAGLIQEEDTNSRTSLPGLARVPILGSIFGHSFGNKTSLDVVMIITPHIIRSHELEPGDFKPRPAGTAQNPGISSVPSLLPPGTPPPPALAPPGTGTGWCRFRRSAAPGSRRPHPPPAR